MGKKSSGKHYTSKGERRSSISTKNRDPGQRLLNQLDALIKGKDVVMTIQNPNKNETNKRLIKTKISGKQFVKKRLNGYQMKGEVAE